MIMRFPRLFTLWVCLTLALSLTAQTYRLAKPDTIWYLPYVLEEISGLTFSPDERWLLAVQDEWGDVYGLDPLTGCLDTAWRFVGKGDFEGIALADSVLYVLRSDGSLFYSVWEAGPRDEVQRVKTQMPKKSDLEGLAWDPELGRLLLAVKDEPGESQRKGFYLFDPTTGVRDSLLLGFDKATFRQVVQRDLKGGARKRLLKWLDKRPEFRLGPSGIAIHPISGELYMLSSRGNVLMQLSRDGQLKKVHALDKKLFPQPEGIAFNGRGDLFIANEGQKHSKPGTVLVFRWRP
jgi:uncharacterized protein YjiK